MFRQMFATLTLGAALCGVLLVSTLSAAETANKPSSTVAELNHFTNFAYIPERADQSSIRFEKTRRVVVPTRIRYSSDASACAELAFRDPGGATGCPNLHTEANAEAYEVTYFFRAQPLASDESGNTHFTFHAYFRLDELGPDVRQSLSAEKQNRADVAGYFAVSAVKNRYSASRWTTHTRNRKRLASRLTLSSLRGWLIYKTLAIRMPILVIPAIS